MQRLYTLDEYLERITWIKAARRDISVTSDIIVVSGRTEVDSRRPALLDRVGYDHLRVQVLATPTLRAGRKRHPREEKVAVWLSSMSDSAISRGIVTKIPQDDS
jgi:hypothetical protein